MRSSWVAKFFTAGIAACIARLVSLNRYLAGVNRRNSRMMASDFGESIVILTST
jgi:hypothetical protein